MKEYKGVFRFAMISVKRQLKNAGFYIVLAVIFIIIKLICYGIGDYLHLTGDKMNLFEIYIWFMSARPSQIIYLLGLVLIICGCAFFSNGATYNLLRMRRKSWVASHIIYMVIIIAIFNLWLLISFWIACKGAVTIKGAWSNAAYVAGQFWIEDIGIRSVMGVNYKMLSFNPNLVGVLTFVISMFIGLFVGMILLIFMLYGKSAWGIACIGLVWFADMLFVERFTWFAFGRIFPFSLSRTGQLGFCSGGPSVPYAIAYFVLVTVALIVILERISKKIDFVKVE